MSDCQKNDITGIVSGNDSSDMVAYECDIEGDNRSVIAYFRNGRIFKASIGSRSG